MKKRAKKRKPYKRGQWLRDMIKYNDFKIGAEVGVLKGAASAYMLETGAFMYFIDLWECRPEIMGEHEVWRQSTRDQNAVLNAFLKVVTPYRGQYKIHRGVSWEMADKIEDGSLDFVFIDADHCYESVKKDIIAWRPKVRKGGILCGHDINISGVDKAVKELIPDYIDSKCDWVWWVKI